MKLAVIGTGYVGLVAGAGFSDFGNDVVCVDVDQDKIAKLQAGVIPIYEPGLATLVKRNTDAGRLRFCADVSAAIASAEVIFVAVGTPQAEDGSADMSAVWAVAETIATSLTGFAIVVIKSTVLVGTSDRVREIVAKHTRHEFAVVSNPEFLKEGDAINDFMKPQRVIVGTDDERARTALESLYAPLLRTNNRLLFMDARSAELTKYAANAFLATRISFMNELANLADELGADIESIRKGLGSDPRIGPKFLFPGVGYGGSCFPKDLKALLHTAAAAKTPLRVVSASDQANDRQKLVLVDKLQKHFGGDVKGKRVAVWGLSFKPGTDDIREAPALTIIDRLLDLGAVVSAHDPVAIANSKRLYGERVRFFTDMYEALGVADALLLVTEWREFRRPDFARIKKCMASPTVFDGRNAWDPKELRKLGFTYYGIGRP